MLERLSRPRSLAGSPPHVDFSSARLPSTDKDLSKPTVYNTEYQRYQCNELLVSRRYFLITLLTLSLYAAQNGSIHRLFRLFSPIASTSCIFWMKVLYAICYFLPSRVMHLFSFLWAVCGSDGWQEVFLPLYLVEGDQSLSLQRPAARHSPFHTRIHT